MRKNTIWITGSAGRLGRMLTEVLSENTDNKVIGTDLDVDITKLEDVEKAISVYHPNVVINCAALSDMEYCEKNMVEAFKVNALGARNLATASRKVNAKIIQFSTDDVFSEKSVSKLTEFDATSPDTVYGKSKLAGENYVRELNPKHLIIRSSWLYGIEKGNYFSYVLSKASNKETFYAPLDIISTPTSAYRLANFIAEILEKSEYGIFHASCEGQCSRYEFAKTILEYIGADTNLVQSVSASEVGLTPSSTLLENLMLKMTEIYEMPQWQEDLKSYINHWKAEVTE